MVIEKIVDRIKEEKGKIIVYSHIDADGLCSAGIFSTVLERAGIEHEMRFLKQIDGTPKGGDLTIFLDFGSGQLEMLKELGDVIVIDHHQPQNALWGGLIHLNSYDLGIDGSNGISGAGMSYLVGQGFGDNRDLAYLAVIGAVGDIQDFWGKMEEKNVEFLEQAVENGQIKVEDDVALYGRHSRPIFKSLQYFTDPYVPGVSNSESGSHAFLKGLGIKMKSGFKFRTMAELSFEERQRLGNELIKRALRAAPPKLKKYVPKLIVGETYELLNEEPRTELRDVDEFSTVLNACGKNGNPELGFEIAKGNREKEDEMNKFVKKHRQNLARGMEKIEKDIFQENGYQYFDARDKVSETLVGTVAGMLLGSEYTDPYKPILGISKSDEILKISGRCSRLLVLDGENLGLKLRKASEAVGGFGGGHAPAGGAFVPEEKLEEFLSVFGH